MKGLIYKQSPKKYDRMLASRKEFKVEKVSDIGDIEYKIANISGNLDMVMIEGFPLSEIDTL